MHCQPSKERSLKPETPLLCLSNIPVTAIPNSQLTFRLRYIQVQQKRLQQSNTAWFSIEDSASQEAKCSVVCSSTTASLHLLLCLHKALMKAQEHLQVRAITLQLERRQQTKKCKADSMRLDKSACVYSKQKPLQL